jgi:hypothetical protein
MGNELDCRRREKSREEKGEKEEGGGEKGESREVTYQIPVVAEVKWLTVLCKIFDCVQKERDKLPLLSYPSSPFSLFSFFDFLFHSEEKVCYKKRYSCQSQGNPTKHLVQNDRIRCCLMHSAYKKLKLQKIKTRKIHGLFSCFFSCSKIFFFVCFHLPNPSLSLKHTYS